jgi:toxin HigB-1
MGIRSFVSTGTADIASDRQTKAARRLLPVHLHRSALEKLVLLDAAVSLNDLAAWPSLNLEKLKGDPKGQYSSRINSQYRICFVWEQNNARQVEIVDYH